MATADSAPVTLALLGDTPYSTEEEVAFPLLVDAINADPAVEMVLHAGDTKSGEMPCTTDRYQDRLTRFNTFVDPFVITPGDNDWTDCHGVAAGQYVPTERLDTFRGIFYPQPGVTLGKNPATVTSQASTAGYSAFRENVTFDRAGVVFATVHVVGSLNDRAPWSGLPGGDMRSARTAEFQARDSANVAWVNNAFTHAKDINAPGVLLLLQAEPRDSYAFNTVRNAILSQANAFGGKVLIAHGDGHVYTVTPNYGGLPNVTRLETYGETASKWIKVTVDPSSPAVFSWDVKTVAAPDTTAPTVKTSTPASGATGVLRGANIKATFSENVTGVNATTMTLKRTASGAQVAADVTYSTTSSVATLNPAVYLSANTTYTVTLSSGIADEAGNPLVATTWDFTTGG